MRSKPSIEPVDGLGPEDEPGHAAPGGPDLDTHASSSQTVLYCALSRSSLQVARGLPEACRVIPEHPEGCVAGAAQNAPEFVRLVIVIGLRHHRLRKIQPPFADGTPTALESQERLECFRIGVVLSAKNDVPPLVGISGSPPLHVEALCQIGRESRRNRV